MTTKRIEQLKRELECLQDKVDRGEDVSLAAIDEIRELITMIDELEGQLDRNVNGYLREGTPRETLYEGPGIQVYAEDGQVFITDDEIVKIYVDTPASREKCIEQAQEVAAEWERELEAPQPMKVRVFNDGVQVFEGDGQEFLEANGGDEDIAEMLQEVAANGFVARDFFHSGKWEIKKGGQ